MGKMCLFILSCVTDESLRSYQLSVLDWAGILLLGGNIYFLRRFLKIMETYLMQMCNSNLVIFQSKQLFIVLRYFFPFESTIY